MGAFVRSYPLKRSCRYLRIVRGFESCNWAPKMVEVRTVSRTAVAERSGGGFFIRRVESPGAVVEKGAAKRLARRPLTPSSNKENVPPAWAVATTQKRRSTLPEWYPRSPLRDITSIIKVINYSIELLGGFLQMFWPFC